MKFQTAFPFSPRYGIVACPDVIGIDRDRLTRCYRRKVANGFTHRYCRRQFAIEEHSFRLCNVLVRTPSIARIRGRRQMWLVFASLSNKDYSFPFLWDTEICCIQDTNARCIPKLLDSQFNLRKHLAFLVVLKTDNVFENDKFRSKKVYKQGELFKERISPVVFIDRTEWSNRRKSLAGRPGDHYVDRPLTLSKPFRNISHSNVSDILADRQCSLVISGKRVNACFSDLHAKHDIKAFSLHEAMREAAGSKKKIRHCNAHLSFTRSYAPALGLLEKTFR